MRPGGILIAVTAVTIGACGVGDAPSRPTVATATVSLLDREWQIDGTCELSGDDLTFIAPGDPMLSLGINKASNSDPVGNFSSAREGFGVIIGSPDAPTPAVERTGDSFTVSGTFLVFDEDRVEGSVTVDCNA